MVPFTTLSMLSELALKIQTSAAVIDEYLKTNNLPAPSFDENAPQSLPSAPEVVAAKMELLELLIDMSLLVQGPTETLTLACQVRKHRE
jgi:6-hydroxytryprostatin B O-methyltransferase